MQYMDRMKKYGIAALFAASGLLAACSGEEPAEAHPAEYTSVTVNLGMNEATRAAVNYKPEVYSGRYYLYVDNDLEDGANYVYDREGELNSDALVLTDLLVGASYKLVLMATPFGQKPAVPTPEEMGDVQYPYEEQTIPYLNNVETSEPEKANIYRDILTFTASSSTGEQNAVLTRQNGAVEVRIKNRKMKKVELFVNGTRTIYLNDGTGGQVLSEDEFPLSAMMEEDDVNKTEVRIRVNLLPQENIAADAGKDSPVNDPDIDTSQNRLEITGIDGTLEKIDLKSDQGAIPVYPNQITWLTLGNDGDGGRFDVSFSGNVNLEDPDNWGGWNNQN